jgi:hypothetical protein
MQNSTVFFARVQYCEIFTELLQYHKNSDSLFIRRALRFQALNSLAQLTRSNGYTNEYTRQT